MDRHMLDYLPPIMKDYEEIEQICNAEQLSKEKLWNNLEKAFYECHLSTQSKKGAERWEKTLGIIPKDTDSLEVRNLRILAKLHEDLPYTYRTFKRMLSGLAGGDDAYTFIIDFDAYTVSIKVALKNKELLNEIDVLADRIIPAHMILIVELMYNTHRMIKDAGKTHADLSALTHKKIKETLM